MAAPSSIDVSSWLYEQLAEASPDLLRAMVQAFAEALMSAEADAVCGAAFGERSSERTNSRNGYRRRGWDTRAGSIDLGTRSGGARPPSPTRPPPREQTRSAGTSQRMRQDQLLLVCDTYISTRVD
jgi:hypothetical protein